MPLLSPNWRSLFLWNGYLTIPGRERSKRIARGDVLWNWLVQEIKELNLKWVISNPVEVAITSLFGGFWTAREESVFFLDCSTNPCWEGLLGRFLIDRVQLSPKARCLEVWRVIITLPTTNSSLYGPMILRVAQLNLSNKTLTWATKKTILLFILLLGL